MKPIYLDHNSTTPILPEVAEAMYAVHRAGYVNPASQHQPGQKARRLLEETREAIIALLGGKTSGMDADRLVFTSGGTEANNLALRGLGQSPARVVISAIEHPSVQGVAEYLATQGFQVDRIPVDARGCVDVSTAEQLIDDGTPPSIVSVMLANNETGVLQPIQDLADMCHTYDLLVHCDAVQGVGKVPVDFRALGVDVMTIAAHKFYGPLGIGALLLRQPVKLEPQLLGGFQQEGLRPGTECLALAVGMRVALEQAQQKRMTSEARDAFEAHLLRELPGVVINGAAAARLPNTSNVAFVGLDRQELLLALDMAGVCCSTGSACASGSSEPSPVLLAMGLPDEVIRSSLRFSFGVANTPAEGLEAASRIVKTVNDLRARKSARNSPLSPRQSG